MSYVQEVFYLAICMECTPIRPQPFSDETERDEWTAAHRTTGHRVRTAVEVRTPPDTPATAEQPEPGTSRP